MEEIDKVLLQISQDDENESGKLAMSVTFNYLYIDTNAIDIFSEESGDINPHYDLANDIVISDPSVKYFIIKNLNRFIKTVGDNTRQAHLIRKITNSEFIADISPYSELVYEYVKQIIKFSTLKNISKLLLIRTLESLLNDSLENYIIESIEWGMVL